MAGFEAELADAVVGSREEMLALARGLLAASDRVSTTSDEQLEQLVRAGEAMLLEALEGRDETRRFVIETAVPAYVAAGESAATIASSSVTSAVLVSSLLAGKVSEANREAALSWLAAYYGSHLADVLAAVTEAQA
jgi:hypothetical protein